MGKNFLLSTLKKRQSLNAGVGYSIHEVPGSLSVFSGEVVLSLGRYRWLWCNYKGGKKVTGLG